MKGPSTTYTIDFGKPNPVQQRALDLYKEGKKVVLINTGRQAGKSHFGARWAMMEIQRRWDDTNKLGLVVVPTNRIGRVARRKFEEVLQLDNRLWKLIVRREQPILTYTFPNGWAVEFHSAENPDSLRGPTASWVWMDEAAMCPPEAFDIVMPTLLATDGSFLGTTTPRGVENWTYDKIYVKTIPPGEKDYNAAKFDPNYGVVVGSTWENKANLSERAVQLLSEQYGGEDSYFGRQEIRGEFVSFEGRVYQWDPMTDYVSLDKLPPIDECTVVCGAIDFGWSPDPTAAYVMGYKDGTWYIYDELYETELLKEHLGAELAHMTAAFNVPIWWADSANPDDIQELRNMGIPVRPVTKPKILTRIREMAAFANTGRLKASYRCPNVRNEFLVYQWSEKLMNKPGSEKKPIDRDNHAMDAIGYGIWMNRHLWTGKMYLDETDSPTPDAEARLQQMYERLTGTSSNSSPGGYSGLYGS